MLSAVRGKPTEAAQPFGYLQDTHFRRLALTLLYSKYS